MGRRPRAQAPGRHEAVTGFRDARAPAQGPPDGPQPRRAREPRRARAAAAEVRGCTAERRDLALRPPRNSLCQVPCHAAPLARPHLAPPGSRQRAAAAASARTRPAASSPSAASPRSPRRWRSCTATPPRRTPRSWRSTRATGAACTRSVARARRARRCPSCAALSATCWRCDVGGARPGGEAGVMSAGRRRALLHGQAGLSCTHALLRLCHHACLTRAGGRPRGRGPPAGHWTPRPRARLPLVRRPEACHA
jgi:hypothetical protein